MSLAYDCPVCNPDQDLAEVVETDDILSVTWGACGHSIDLKADLVKVVASEKKRRPPVEVAIRF